jgi:hypothetical protein
MEKKSKAWKTVAETAAAPVGLAAGIVGGVVNAATGHGGFVEGLENTANDIVDSAGKFGEEHGSALTEGIIRGAASSATSNAMNRGRRSSD